MTLNDLNDYNDGFVQPFSQFEALVQAAKFAHKASVPICLIIHLPYLWFYKL